MSQHEPDHGTGGSQRTTDALGDGSTASSSRRSFLKGAAGAGAVLAGLGVGTVGAASSGIINTPYLHRDGNVMRDPQDNRVVPRGMNMIDPKRLQTKEFRPTIDETLERMTDRAEGWYTNVIRIPVQPLDIGGHSPGGIPPVPAFDEGQLQSYIENYLDPTVEKCAELGVYCIVDYHRHKGNSEAHRYTSDPMDEELRLFWNTVAPRYESYSNVVYEVYNEPIAPYPGYQQPTVNVGVTEQRAKEEGWDVWKEAAQPWVDVIREHAPQNPIIIGSPRWSQYTYWAPKNEFEGDNLAYVGHVYSQDNLRPLGDYFGAPSEEVPVWMTEFGWAPYGAGYIKGTAEKEGEQFTSFFEEYDHVPWTVWCFDSKWSPAMLDHDFSLNSFGQFWKDFLAVHGTEDLPAGSGTEATTTEGTPVSPTSPADQWTNSVTATTIEMGWESVADATGYRMYLDGSMMVETADTVATLSNLSPETSYEVGLTAYNAAGESSMVTTSVQTAAGTTTTESTPVGTPGPVGGNDALPGDPDADGLYEDVNGNERQDIADAVDLFQNRDSVDAGFFDFNDSGSMEIGDAVELFRENTQ